MLRRDSRRPPHQPSARGAKAFDTPQQAADAVIKAAGDYDVPQLMAIFGPDGEDFVSGGDPVQAKNNAIEFAKEAQAKNSITMESSKPGQPVERRRPQRWELHHNDRSNTKSRHHHRRRRGVAILS